jgi:hypothetical protein
MNCVECGAEQVLTIREYVLTEIICREIKDVSTKITVSNMEIWKCLKCDEEEISIPHAIGFYKAINTICQLFPNHKEVFLKFQGNCWLISLEKFT